MREVWIGLHLLLLSAEDIREGQLYMPFILELGITGVVYSAAAGILPAPGLGLMLLAIGYFSKEQIGYGDGWLMTALGMWMPEQALFQIFFFGVGFAAVYAVCVRKKEVPFVPFLTAAYMIGVWI